MVSSPLTKNTTELSFPSLEYTNSIDSSLSINSDALNNIRPSVNTATASTTIIATESSMPSSNIDDTNPQVDFYETTPQQQRHGRKQLEGGRCLNRNNDSNATFDTDDTSFLSGDDDHDDPLGGDQHEPKNCWLRNPLKKLQPTPLISVEEYNNGSDFEIQYDTSEMELPSTTNWGGDGTPSHDPCVNDEEEECLSNPNEAQPQQDDDDNCLCAADFAIEAMSSFAEITTALSCDEYLDYPELQACPVTPDTTSTLLRSPTNKHSRGRPIISERVVVEDSTLSEAYSQKSIAMEFLDRGRLSEALISLEEVLQLAHEAGLNENHTLVTDTMWHFHSARLAVELLQDADEMHQLGDYYENIGEYHKALESYEGALNKKTRAKANVPTSSMLSTLHKVGVVRWKTGDYDEALDLLTEALHMNNNNSDDQSDTREVELATAEILSSIAHTHLSRGDYAQAEEFFKCSLMKRRRVYGNHYDHPDVARSIIGIGMVCDAQGRHKKAMKFYLEGLRIQRKLLCNDNVDVAATLNSIGIVHEKRHAYTEAMACYQEALFIYRTSLGNNHVDVAVTLVNVGQIHRYDNENRQAMRSYQEALHIFKSLLGNTHRNVASTMHNIGLLHAANREPKTAMDMFKEVLKLQRAALGNAHLDVAVTLDSMAEVFEDNGKLQKGLKLYGKALKVRRAALGNDHVYVGMTLDRLGTFYKDRIVDTDEAFHHYTEALFVYKANSIKEDDSRIKTLMRNMETVQPNS